MQRFNDWDSDRENEAVSLARYAAASARRELSSARSSTIDHGWSEPQLEEMLRHSLRMLRPILLDHGVTGYVEPLGMKGSTMKRQATAVAPSTTSLAGMRTEFVTTLFSSTAAATRKCSRTASDWCTSQESIATDLPPGDLTEPDRGLVNEKDRVGIIRQLRSLIDGGYAGYVSIEPFKPSVQQDPEPRIEA